MTKTDITELNGQPNGDHTAAKLLAIPGIRIEKDFPAILKANKVSVDDEIELPPICLEIGKDGEYSTVATLGNISLIIAKAKQGKTFTISLFISAALNNTPVFNQLRATLPANQSIAILFDTEQSKYHVQRVLKRICYLSRVDRPQTLLVYSLRGLTPHERLETIEYALYNTTNLGLVVIDGIRDLITSINDEDQASMITSKLLKWTEDLNIHIMTVLHQNKGDLNARGHLGTELTNKSETVISISKSSDDNAVSIVQPEYCRDKEFEPFAFRIDEHGIPVVLSDWTATKESTKTPKKSVAAHEVPAETHNYLLGQIFSIQTEMRYAELKTNTKANLDRCLSTDIGLNKVEGWISYWKQFEFLLTSGTPGTRSFIYKINSNAPKKLN
jgi:hypothetical protein